jgi:hypothetical protein
MGELFFFRNKTSTPTPFKIIEWPVFQRKYCCFSLAPTLPPRYRQVATVPPLPKKQHKPEDKIPLLGALGRQGHTPRSRMPTPQSMYDDNRLARMARPVSMHGDQHRSRVAEPLPAYEKRNLPRSGSSSMWPVYGEGSLPRSILPSPHLEYDDQTPSQGYLYDERSLPRSVTASQPMYENRNVARSRNGHLPISSEDQILSRGCNPGHVSDPLQEYDKKVHGTDRQHFAFEAEDAFRLSSPLNLEVFGRGRMPIPFDNASYDGKQCYINACFSMIMICNAIVGAYFYITSCLNILVVSNIVLSSLCSLSFCLENIAHTCRCMHRNTW